MNDIRTCLQRLVDIWEDPGMRHEMPGAMWHAKEALKKDAMPDCSCSQLFLHGCRKQDCPRAARGGAKVNA